MLRNLNLLVADDAPAMRFALAESLRRAGASVDEAARGTEALSLCRRNAYHLLLLDLDMPGMHGLELSQTLRNAGFSAAILALCDVDEPLRRRCLAAGMDAVLPKPCPRKLLLEQVLAFCGRPSGVVPAVSQVSFAPFLELCEGDKMFMQRLLDIAAKAIPAAALALREASAAGDSLKLGAVAHRVRSSVDGLGLTTLAARLRWIESIAQSGAYTAYLAGLAQQAAFDLEQAGRQIAEQRPQLLTLLPEPQACPWHLHPRAHQAYGMAPGFEKNQDGASPSLDACLLPCGENPLPH